jgi:hypothetical protein
MLIKKCAMQRVCFVTLIQDIYGWQPDFWTLFKKESKESVRKLTVVVAY